MDNELSGLAHLSTSHGKIGSFRLPAITAMMVVGVVLGTRRIPRCPTSSRSSTPSSGCSAGFVPALAPADAATRR